jgi:hypothetical protein
MYKDDLDAYVSSILEVLKKIGDADSGFDLVGPLSTLKLLISELEECAVDRRGGDNARVVLLEIFDSARAASGLRPSSGRTKEEHLHSARMSVQKLEQSHIENTLVY